MERLEDANLDERRILRAEHRHRYEWAAAQACGDVLDLACGVGYGSEILSANPRVTSYLGIDMSESSVAEANRRFSRSNRKFLRASALEIPLAESSVDTVVSLETLEHLHKPESAISEFKRILRPEGLLLGSVPSRHFDDRCEVVYGRNEYHVTRFDAGDLRALLSQHFRTVRLQYSAIEVTVHLGSLENDDTPSVMENTIWRDDSATSSVNGSIHFIATNADVFATDPDNLLGLWRADGFTEFEATHIVPLRSALSASEKLTLLRQDFLDRASDLLMAKDLEIEKMGKALIERDVQLTYARSLIGRLDLRTLKNMIRRKS